MLYTDAMGKRLTERKNGIFRIIKKRMKAKTVVGCCDLKYESIALMYVVQFEI
jgi:hypothetical protein